MSTKRCDCPEGLPYITQLFEGSTGYTIVHHATMACEMPTKRLSAYGKDSETFTRIVDDAIGRKGPLYRSRERGER